MERKIQTLAIPIKPSKILLGKKKKGFGQGRWNGFGGKIEENETIEMAAVRELKEEAGIQAVSIEKSGVLEFFSPDEILEVHLFKIISYKGKPRETEEMVPYWFEYDNIPFENMWPDDRFWMPYFISGKKFRAVFKFSAEFKKMENYKITEI